MKNITMMSKSRFFALLAIISMAVMAANCVYSDTNERGDYMSNDQAGIFSPGYINASKHHTAEIINQQGKPKSFMENAMNYVNNKLFNKVTEDSNDIEAPELQKKTGALGDGSVSAPSAAQSIAAVQSIASISIDEIPAYVRNSVQEYCNERGIIAYPQIKAAGEKYYVFWNEYDSSNNHSLKTQVFDSGGNALFDTPGTLANGMMNAPDIENITALENGNLAIFWNERDSMSLRAQVFDSSGTMLFGTPTTIGTGAGLENVTALKNGNLAVIWSEYDSNYNMSLKTQMFSSSGNALFETPTTIGAGGNLQNTTALQNGNLAVFWDEYDSNYNQFLKTQVFDLNGNEVFTAPVTLNAAGSGLYDYRFTALGSGDLAVFWSEYDSNYNLSLKTQIFDQTGNALFETPASLTGDRALGDLNISNITTLENGNLGVFWSETDSTSWNVSLKAQIFDSNGTALTAPATLTGAEVLNGAYISNVTALESGNLAVFWSEYDSSYNAALKTQVFDSSGNALFAPATLASNMSLVPQIDNVTTLENGNIVVFWDTSATSGLKFQVFDSIGNVLMSAPSTIESDGNFRTIANVTALEDGNFAVFWTIANTGTVSNNPWFGDPIYVGSIDPSYSSLKSQIFDSNGNALFAIPATLATTFEGDNRSDIVNVTELENGNLEVFWNYDESGGYNSLLAQVFDTSANELVDAPIILGSGAWNMDITEVAALENGNFALFWNEQDSNGNISMRSQSFGSEGELGSAAALGSPNQVGSLGGGAGNRITFNANPFPYLYNNFTEQMIDQNFTESSKSSVSIAPKEISGIFKGLLASKDLLLKDATDTVDQAMLGKILRDAANETGIPKEGDINPQEMRLAMALANILKNPTEDQKEVLDILSSIMNEVNKQIQGADSTELKKAEDALLQMAASVLMAQAIPDLLNEGDVAKIRSIFSELAMSKVRIISDYQKSTKPYYDEVIKELSRNISMLQIRNIISGNMTKEELEKLPPLKIGEILDKLRKSEKKTFEEEYILQQEAKYREKYIDPNKKQLEDSMKAMMQQFSKRLYSTLDAANVAEGKTVTKKSAGELLKDASNK